MYVAYTIKDWSSGNRADVKQQNAQARAQETLQTQIEVLSNQHKTTIDEASDALAQAKKSMKAKNRTQAAAHMRRHKTLKVRAESLQGALRKVEDQKFALDQTELVSGIVKAHQEVQAVMQNKNLRRMADDALDVAEELGEMKDDLDEVAHAITTQADCGQTDQDLLEELEESMLDAQLAELDIDSPVQSMSQPEPETYVEPAQPQSPSQDEQSAFTELPVDEEQPLLSAEGH